MTASEAAAVRDVIAGMDTAFNWLDAEIARLQRALAAGIELPTIGAINRAIYLAKQGESHD